MSAPIEPKLGRILHIALPIVVSNASYTAMLFIDRLFLSQVGKHELAAAMSGGMTAFVVMSFFIGLIGYAAALVAQYYGAGRRETREDTVARGALPVGAAATPPTPRPSPAIKSSSDMSSLSVMTLRARAWYSISAVHAPLQREIAISGPYPTVPAAAMIGFRRGTPQSVVARVDMLGE